jgi:hypothetical protein
VERRSTKPAVISKKALLFWVFFAFITFSILSYNAYQAWLTYFVATGEAPPPKSMFPEWTLDTSQQTSPHSRVKLPARWLPYGEWQMPYCPLLRNRLPLSQVCYRLPELVVALNQADQDIGPFNIERSKTDADRVKPTLIVTCDEGTVSLAIGIDNKHRPVEWWQSVPILWKTNITGGMSTWSYNANSRGAGVWMSPNPEAMLQQLAGANTLEVKLSPPSEDEVIIKFSLNGIDHVDGLMRKHCPSSPEISAQ